MRGLSIAPGTTGVFEDMDRRAGEIPSHGSRMSLLYVDFDGAGWRTPEEGLRKPGFEAKVSISETVMRDLIDELRSIR